MRDEIQFRLAAGVDRAALVERLARVLDPEIDEPIVELGFVRSIALEAGHARVALRLPTSWCAVNFAYLMAEDVRRALLAVDGVEVVTIGLGDHCAAAEIEAGVNAGRSFADAFPGEAGGGMAALRLGFLRKGFLIRQERLLRQLRDAGCGFAAVAGLRLGALSIDGERMLIGSPGSTPAAPGSAAVLRRYLERRAELGLDCGPAAPLAVDLDGRPVPAAELHRHYEAARTVRVAQEANAMFCRALMGTHRLTDAAPIETGRGSNVQS